MPEYEIRATSKKYLNRKGYTWNFLVARDISQLILSKNMEFGMGHNNQPLLQAGFRNKLVAKLKSLDIKVTKKRVGAKKRDGGGG